MIYVNAKRHRTAKMAVIFGLGTLRVGAQPDTKRLVIAKAEPAPIGPLPESARLPPVIVLEFLNVESLDVLTGELAKIRERLVAEAQELPCLAG